ncbi:MAG TPA: universal stress protein [Thermomicrobiales bacterium]|nr:universal stress protein [Thermomicrobiales bacterium]
MDDFPRRILLATDGSADAALAARAALDLADAGGAELHLAHAWQPIYEASQPYLYPNLAVGGYYPALEEEARAILERERARIAAARGAIHAGHLVEGRPADAIVRLGDDLDADLVVIGSRGLGPVRRLAIGSVSEAVVHHATRPTLVVRGGEAAWPPAQVVAGDDGSATAGRAGALAARLAGLVGARLTLARACPALPLTPHLTREDLAELQEEALRRAREGLAETARRLEAATGRPGRVATATADPAALLLDLAEASEQPALLAVGSRGLGLLGRLRLGSTSTRVLRAARGPVLVAPPGPAGHEAG